MASNGAGWVAVGRHELDGRVWMSDDAAAWQRRTTPPSSTQHRSTSLEEDPVSWPSATSTASEKAATERAAVWVSADGRTWHLVEPTRWPARLDSAPSSSIRPTAASSPSGSTPSGDRATASTGLRSTTAPSRSGCRSPGPPPTRCGWATRWWPAVGTLSLWTSTDRGETWERHNPDDPVLRQVHQRPGRAPGRPDCRRRRRQRPRQRRGHGSLGRRRCTRHLDRRTRVDPIGRMDRPS